MHGQATPVSATRQPTAWFEGALTLGSRTVLIAWRETGGTGAQRRWRALEAGVEARPPRARLTLAAPDGASALHLLMLAQPKSGKLRLEPAAGVATLAVELATAPPLGLAELARALATADRRRLLGWLLGVCPTLFQLGAEPELGFAVRDLLQALLPPVRLGAALRRCHAPGGWTLLETMIGDGFGQTRLDAFVLAPQGGLRRALVPSPAPDPSAAGRYPICAAFEDLRPGEAATLVIIGAGGIACRRIEAARGRLPAAADWIAAVAGRGRRLTRENALNALALLAERQAAKPGYAALVREVLRVAPAPPPVFSGRLWATLAAVTAVERRIVVIGSLTDPDRMVAGLRLRRLGTPDIEIRVADLILGARGGSDERAFTAMSIAPAQGHARLPWRGYLVLSSGTEVAMGEAPVPEMQNGPLEYLLEAAAPMAELPAAWPLLEPAARAAASARLAGRRDWATRLLGPPLLRPRASLVVPFRQADEATRLVAMLEAEPEACSVELVLVAMEPDPRVELEAAVLAARHGKAVRLVLPSVPLTSSDAPWVGIDATEAPVIVSVGLGIVPRVRGWLRAVLVALDCPAGSEAGLALAGLPLAGLPDPGPLPSLAVLAGVRRDALLAAGGLASDWLDSDHRDADLALRLLAAGFRARMLAGPCCVRAGLHIPSRSAAAARLAAALDTRRLADRAADCRQRRATQSSSTARPERLALAR